MKSLPLPLPKILVVKELPTSNQHLPVPLAKEERVIVVADQRHFLTNEPINNRLFVRVRHNGNRAESVFSISYFKTLGSTVKN